MTDLYDRARAWIDADPDPVTRHELQALLEDRDDQELQSRFDGTLAFGTAGIRGEVAAGPNRMNRAVVIKTTKGLADYIVSSSERKQPLVVVGFDARPSSRQLAEDAAGVLAAAGIEVVYFPEVTPTPLVAFTSKQLGCDAAVIVTASHNPPADNGYKVYASNAAQIVSPTDASIRDAIEETGNAAEIPRVDDAFSAEHPLLQPVDQHMLDEYWDAVNRSRPDPHSSHLRIVYTPMHGVGGAVITDLFARAGHRGLMSVPEQFEPDGTFPTVSFPNPEEPGALDLALDLARTEAADLIIANDPDADRLAAVVPTAGEWQVLSGNDLGVLLGDFILRNHDEPTIPIVINSIVSSPMLGSLAAVRGAIHDVTLTGFKWIANAALAKENAGEGVFVFGYEEALGYSVGKTVRDKDGISAAIVFCDLVESLRLDGLTVLDRLAALWGEVGLWASAQHSLVRPGSEGQLAIKDAVERLSQSPPAFVGGLEVTKMTDYRQGEESRPPWLGAQDLIALELGGQGRILVRPSGTEPKLKIYVDLVADSQGDAHAARAELQAEAEQMAATTASTLGI